MADVIENLFQLLLVITILTLLSIGKQGIAIYMIIATRDLRHVAGDGYLSIAFLLLVLEVSVSALFFLGCCACIFNYRRMFIPFGIMSGVILLIELGAGSSVLITMKQTEGNIEKRLNSSFTNYDNDIYPDQTQMWDQLQQDLHCCGLINNGTDYQTILNEPIPVSCCINATGCNTTISSEIFSYPCTNAINDLLYDGIDLAAQVAIAMAVLHMLLVVLIFVHHFDCCRNLRRTADGYEDIESD